MSIGLFLATNGYQLVAAQLDAIGIVLGVASGDIDEAALAVWIAANIAVR